MQCFGICDLTWGKQAQEQICTGVQCVEHRSLEFVQHGLMGVAVLRRRGKLGDSLVSALEHFIDNERISPDLALKVLAEVRCHLPAYCVQRLLPC